MNISGNNIILRAPEPEDLDFMYRLENTTERADASFATAPLSRQQLAVFIENYSADIFADKQLRLVIEAEEGSRIGVIDISDFNPRDRHGFVGIAIAEQYRHLGFGHDALSLLCDHAWRVLGMHSLCAVVGEDNEASRRLFLSCGFKGCGRLRSWIRNGGQYADGLLLQRVFA